jgi:hypothetical protein
VNWHVLTRLAVAIAAAAAIGLGIDVAVAGTTQAAGLAGVIVGFCELGALVLGVGSWAARRQEAGDQRDSHPPEVPERAGQEADGIVPPVSPSAKYIVDTRQAQAVQIGDHSTQHNDFRSELGRTDER